ncbi:MAG: hypothetical protein ACFFCS_09550 [Candidatus Hodarchaeota archaeon]
MIDSTHNGMPILPSIGDLPKKNEIEITSTVVQCVDCKEEFTRDYKEGDIVFEDAEGESCAKCHGKLVVSQIFVEIVKKKKGKEK